MADGTRNGRARAHGRQHGAPPAAGGPRVRRLRQASAEACERSSTTGRSARARSRSWSRKLEPPRAVWIMVPAAVVDDTDRAARAAARARRHPHRRRQLPLSATTSAAPRSSRRRGIHYVDVGTSGGVWGSERGYCLMIGGERRRRRSGSTRSSRRSPRPSTRPDARRGAAGTPTHGRARAICTAGRTAPATSSRWCTTASSTASWRPTPKD